MFFLGRTRAHPACSDKYVGDDRENHNLCGDPTDRPYVWRREGVRRDVKEPGDDEHPSPNVDASWLDHAIGRQDVIVLLLGLLSAIVDNVPLVAAAMGMYALSQYPTDSFLWDFMAYCAGAGGSILILGSAAGVVAMGIEKIRFMWYMRKIASLAMLGYFAGALVYVVQFKLLQ